jgi:uncharacterized protein (TIGR03032 family)
MSEERAAQSQESAGPGTDRPPPLRSVHTSNFPALLAEAGISLLVTTYQAGKLVLVRADGEKLNTHFRDFVSPMGLALADGRLAVGTFRAVWEFHNVPGVAAKLAPGGLHDACFLPRSIHYTGNIAIHEMAWGDLGLWIVNTRFSCLCTLDTVHSFVPRWRPPFITALGPEDRCHLNGLAMVNGSPRYASALGMTDTPAGWRADKAKGGIVLEVPSNEIVARGLSMPHSPRWHNGELWLCESGTGSLGLIDKERGRFEPVVELPGFTRGIDFVGSLAFVGLSQVRESAVFSGIPITERLTERTCGVWVVDLSRGAIVAFLRFEDALQEIFAVQVVRRVRFPDLICDNNEILNDSFVLPPEALADAPAELVVDGSKTRAANNLGPITRSVEAFAGRLSSNR